MRVATVESRHEVIAVAALEHLHHRIRRSVIREDFRASQILQERTFANPKIDVIRNTTVPEIVGNEKGVQHVVLENTRTGKRSNLDVGGVFVFVGFKPNTQLIDGHVHHDPSGYFITDERMMTSIPGLFAAGDVRSQLTRQIKPGMDVIMRSSVMK